MRVVLDPPRPRRFDVISAGEAHWNVDTARKGAPGSAPMGFRAGGGAVSAALQLAQAGLRVGLATALDDDSFGRALVERIGTRGVDVGGVTLAQARSDLVFVEATGRANEVVSYRDDVEPFTVPSTWSSTVLLLSGLSPVVTIAGALCQAARAARRAGAIVVVAVQARAHAWRGRDPRAIRMVLREADVVRCSSDDLDVLRMDVAELRAAVRETTVVVTSNARGDACVTGPFGDVTRRISKRVSVDVLASGGDALTVALCTELARAGEPGQGRPDLWQRALLRGEALASAR